MTALRAHRLALTLVLGFSALLECLRLDQNGWANQYYSAAVKSMLGSLHNFFFVASDPGGLVSVDKPPLGLWLQTLSATVFGFHPLRLLLPLACLTGLRAIETGRWRWLVATAVLVGLAFNTKTLAAYLVLPGLVVA